MSQKFVLLVILSLMLSTVNSQNQKAPEIQLKVSKTMALFNFLKYAQVELPSKNPMVNLIHKAYSKDQKFKKLITDYNNLKLNYRTKLPEYPKLRYSTFSSYKLLQIAAAKSSGLDEFEDRIIGILPLSTHSKFISILRNIEPYYDDLIWKNTKKSNKQIVKQLSPYKKDIQKAFFKASKFYGTDWDLDIPFITSLIPIPFERIEVRGFANGYLLVSEYLTKNEKDYIPRIDVIIHEMCHVLYAQQSPEFQHKLEEMFTQSKSEYAGVAYSYLNEGLATAIGNGWAHKMIFDELPPEDNWYGERIVNDYANVLYPLVTDYMRQNKTIDQAFVNDAISIFEKKFPKAIYDPNILMTETLFYTKVDSREQKVDLAKTWRKYYESGWFYNNMENDFSQILATKNLTKVFLVDSDDSKNELKKINEKFSDLNAVTPEDHIDFLKDDATASVVIIINTDVKTNFEKALKLLKEQKAIEPGKRLSILN